MQFRVWSDLVIAWAKLHKVWSISLQECAIFECKEINSKTKTSLSCRGSALVPTRGDYHIYGIQGYF